MSLWLGKPCGGLFLMPGSTVAACLFSGVARVGKEEGGQWAVSHPIDRIFARQMFTTLRFLVEQKRG